MDKLGGEVLIEFECRQGPRLHWFPMLLIHKNGAIVETCLHLNGFRHKGDCENTINATKEILSIFMEDEGSEL